MDKIGVTNDFLDELLTNASNTYIGMDKLSPKLHNQKNFSVVFNVDGHFVCLLAKKNILLYFDPLGLPPFSSKIRKFIKKDKRKTIISDKTIQHPLSFFCAFFVMCKIISEERPHVKLRKFNFKKLEKNDYICIENITRLLKYFKLLYFLYTVILIKLKALRKRGTLSIYRFCLHWVLNFDLNNVLRLVNDLC